MSLRWRLSAALAALAALATLVMASTAYASTRQRLDVEVDRFLADRIQTLLSTRDRMGPDRFRIGPRVDEVLPVDTQLQLLDRDGEVVLRSGAVVLPVDDAERALAADQASPAARPVRFRSVTVQGVPYRVATSALAGPGAVQVGRELSETQRVLDALRWRFAMVGALVVAGAALVGFLIASRSTVALERLTAAAEQVAGTGDLSVPIAVERADETGRLARALATMLDALARSRQQQRDLVQDASHELRTPITSLRTNIDVLARHPDLGVEQRQAIVAELRLELGELGELLNELVATAADTGEAEEPRLQPFDAVAQHVASRVARRHDRLIEVVGQGAVVFAPPMALARAVTNLLENAVKFSPPGTAVRAELDGGRLTVRDQGPGIDAVEASRVFDRFYRSPAARTLPGSGLGLAIVRQIVEQAEGRVFVVARDQPGGPAVGFELPVAAAPVPAVAVRLPASSALDQTSSSST